MKRENGMTVISFRADDDQVARIERLAKATGKRPSALLRDIIDSALLTDRPVVTSTYQQSAVQHGQ